uniref:Secreted protein n=1 Tax=uncultured bacterium ws633F6 TaxID=1131832 RepID=I1X4Y9_9BACT|nr:secreted protein [uncultured bacterium ws633F6]
MKPLLLSTLLLTSVLLPLAPVSADTVRMMGAGNVSCKEWSQSRISMEYFSAGNWILGFLSSTAWNSGDDILDGKKADILFNAIDEFCTKKPEQTIAEAAVELANHMLDKTSPE